MHPILRYLGEHERSLGWLARKVRATGGSVSRAHLSTITRRGGCSPEMAEVISLALDGNVTPAEIVFWKPPADSAGSASGQAA